MDEEEVFSSQSFAGRGGIRLGESNPNLDISARRYSAGHVTRPAEWQSVTPTERDR